MSRIEYWEWISREKVRQNPDKIFLFGDNLAGYGLKGQAAEMRGEPNAVGIPTKKAPCNYSECFFDDTEFDYIKIKIDEAFSLIPKDKIVVISTYGLGTGLAGLDRKAPKIFDYIKTKIEQLNGNKD